VEPTLVNRREEIRQLNATSDRLWLFLSRGLFVCLGLIILATFLDYGLTYDEEVSRWYGRMVLRWYSTFFQDRSALGYYDLHLYGGFFEAISQLAVSICRKILPLVYETRHLVNALFGFLAVCGTYNLGRHLSGPAAGFFSGLFLTLTPGFYGHIFNNSKDIPFAALFSLALFCIFRTYNRLPAVSYRPVLETGLAIGLALGVRVGGIILLGYLALLWIGWLSVQWMTGRYTQRQLFIIGVRLARPFILIVIVAWAVMLMWWPWAQVAPLKNPYLAMKATANFDWPMTVFFNGRFVPGTELPRSYLPTWLMISLPEFYFIVLLLGCLVAIQFLTRAKKEPLRAEQLIKMGLLLFTIAFPIVTALILHPTMYDGMRQFLFVLPSLTCLAGISLAGFLQIAVNRFIKVGAVMLVMLSIGATVFDMMKLHPYEYVYFNRLFAGGETSAAQRFETDYWGMSYKEGVDWINKSYRPNSRQAIRVANCEVPFLISYYLEKTGELRRRFVVVPLNANPDIYLAITRWQCDKLIEGKLVHTVQRRGTPLLYVIEAQGAYCPEASRKMADVCHERK
jgi:hypothetical protein